MYGILQGNASEMPQDFTPATEPDAPENAPPPAAPLPKETGGPKRDPLRYGGEWCGENGKCVDF